MIRLTDLLKEAKQVGTLYHFTSFDALESILKANTIKGSWGNEDVKGKYISTTRNKNFWKDDPNLGAEELNVALVLNGTKLSNKYKIKPYAYEPYRDLDRSGAEAEELVLLPQGILPNVRSYLLGVMLLEPNKNIEKMLTKLNIPITPDN